jgi:transcriptional regulator PpsR
MSKGPILQSFLDSRLAARVVATVADLALVVDHEGTVVEVTTGETIEAHPGWKKLVGKRWSETLAIDSQRKVEQLLTEAREGRATRSRELNQKVEGVGEIPLRFSAVLLDDRKHVILLGRDLRPLASLQQKIVSAQQAMDREYGRLRQADTRYRLLFHVSSEGVLVADGTSRRVLEANPAAAGMLGESAAALQGKTLQELFEPRSRSIVQDLLAAVDAGARPGEVRVSLLGQKEREVTASAALFRQEGAPVLLLRFWSTGGAATTSASRASRMLTVLDAMPDGFVVTGEDRKILAANAAFCELVQGANENQVIGQPLDRWLGRPGVDLNIMLANLREHGIVKNFATIVRSDFGAPQEAQVTAVSALAGKVPCLGFTIRPVSSRLTSVPTNTVMPRSVEQLRELVGRVSLKELVRESADLIERLCIEAALDVSGNNRASAAQLLGLSRQGLYSKLKRHGLEEFDPT